MDATNVSSDCVPTMVQAPCEACGTLQGGAPWFLPSGHPEPMEETSQGQGAMTQQGKD